MNDTIQYYLALMTSIKPRFSTLVAVCILSIPSMLYASTNEPAYFVVESSIELRQALSKAKAYKLGASIVLKDGIYEITRSPLKINQEFIKIRSESGIRENVVLTGQGMKKGVGSLIDVSADYFSIVGVTLQKSRWHLIQVRAEKDVDYFYMDNCILQDSGQQLFKVSHKKNGPYSNFGIIKNSLFQYTSGMGPNFYIGGIDAHKSVDWLVKDNVFKDISSPSNKVAEHAIHFWNDSKNNNTIGNIILNSDRGIGYGLMDRENQNDGGLISNNIIIHTKPNNRFADVGIGLESSPNTHVIGNVIFSSSSYPNAIEYRFSRTKNVLIKGNITNKTIKSRNKGQATVIENDSSGFSSTIINTLNHAITSKN